MTLSGRLFIGDAPAEFVAVSFTVYVPFTVGVPVIIPAAEQESPFGKPDADHVIGVVPVASSRFEYSSPTVPEGRLVSESTDFDVVILTSKVYKEFAERFVKYNQ